MRCKHIWHDNSKGTWSCGVCSRQAKIDHLEEVLLDVYNHLKSRYNTHEYIMELLEKELKK